jgi:uncharacterized peroxidase-related enzyme
MSDHQDHRQEEALGMEQTRVEPLAREDVPEFEDIFRSFEQNTGTLPNNLLVMARRPSLLRARAAMAEALRDTTLDRHIRDLVFLMASLTTGCRYCRAHRTSAIMRRGPHEEKIRAIWEFETSPLFTPAERAALRLARDSALVPNAVTGRHFADLREHFTEDEIVDIVAQACNAAWSNRWNDTMATPLEPLPLAAMARIDPEWDPGRNRPDR